MAENIEIVKGASLWRDAWRRLRRNKLAMFGLAVIAFMIVAVIVGRGDIWAVVSIKIMGKQRQRPSLAVKILLLLESAVPIAFQY